ncbi:exosortase [Aestuariibacter sp. GS-14]|uniref:exosortase A n=1 Tax=Aestuariibacter sp. GS-14 TaxID=2590670 RepID=UPI00112AC72D|nr:exosortase A [Aestuariibacter sp. GS-14]TPV62127.1 exosortase [Aestuariibacter sp. GS-14]
MQEQSVTGSGHRPPYLSFSAVTVLMAAVLVGWALVFYRGLSSAVTIWYNSDIFNHCMFVLPGAFYLMYLKRDSLLNRPIKPNLWALILVVPLVALYAVGLAGDVQLFMHAAMFALLPVLYWFVLGTRAARTILFPLVFILFCIPLGEELVPYLQQIAATFSVQLLELSGVPVYRSGLYIEIPKGRFLVAEACSGISFFIASLVIGSLYAYLNMQAVWRRATFVLLSILFPVAANIVRVYGIIMIAHMSDMKYAVGADHLIYGWFFFAFVIICLLALGEFIRERSSASDDKADVSASECVTNSASDKVSTGTLRHYARSGMAGLTLVFVFAAVWFQFIAQALPSSSGTEYHFDRGNQYVVESNAVERLPWQAKYRRPATERYLVINPVTGADITVYQAFYAAGQGELISSINRFYDQDNWTKVEDIPVSTPDSPYAMEIISSPTGQLRLLAYWYVLEKTTFASQRDTKIAQIASTLAGEASHGGVVAVSVEVERRQLAAQQQRLSQFITDHYQQFSKDVRLGD